MTTGRQVLQRMVELEGDALGERHVPASGNATTVVVTNIGQGSTAPLTDKYAGTHLIRDDAALSSNIGIDYFRRVKTATFAAGTGVTFTHDGTNWTDTTFTSETLTILNKRFEPKQVIDAAQAALPLIHFQDFTFVPTQKSARYFLNALSWVKDSSYVRSVRYRPDPVLTRNRYFEKWNTVGTDGTFGPPDFWTLAGTSATAVRSTTQQRRGVYSCAITRSGTDCTLSQDPGLLWDAVSGDSLRSQNIAAAAWVWSSTASQVRLRFTDDGGSTYTSSSYHTGGSGWEELTLTATLSSTATTAQVLISVETSNNVCYVDDCWLAYSSSVTDSIRRDDYADQEVPCFKRFEQYPQLAFIGEARGLGGQYVFETDRPYPQFDDTRAKNFAIQADVTDCPVDTLATVALSLLWEWRSKKAPDDPVAAGRAEYWAGQAVTFLRGHRNEQEPPEGGVRVFRPNQRPVARISRGR